MAGHPVTSTLKNTKLKEFKKPTAKPAKAPTIAGKSRLISHPPLLSGEEATSVSHGFSRLSTSSHTTSSFPPSTPTQTQCPTLQTSVGADFAPCRRPRHPALNGLNRRCFA